MCNFLWSPTALYLNHCLCFVAFVRSDDHVTLAFTLAFLFVLSAVYGAETVPIRFFVAIK